MKTVKEFAKGLAAPVLALGLPLVALAFTNPAPGPAPTSPITGISQISGSSGLLCTIINWLFYLLIILAIIFVFVAAFKYLTAGGDPEKVKSAGSTLLYAVIAVVIALIAKGIPLIVSSFLGGPTSGLSC
ncbi:MAG: hypothetical protein ABSE18_00450 [Minisyncoccia bacterium]|jgi:hypothetical protein